MIVDSLEQTWQGILDFMSKVILPDWSGLVGLLPLLVFLGVFGPLLSLLAFVWFVYFVRKPRTAVIYDDAPTPIPRDETGAFVFPRGEPYSPTTGLAYPSGTTRDEGGAGLLVICPMCGLGRDAEIDTCGNCGLVLKVVPRARVLRPRQARPDGAATA